MKRTPRGRYSKEFREEAVKNVIEQGLSVPEVSRRLDVPKLALSYWVKSRKAGNLESIGNNRRDFQTREEVIRDITEYIEIFYNKQRIQKRLRYLPPAAHERKHYEKMITA